MKYDFNAIEARWQAHWAEHDTYRTPNPGDPPDSGFDPGRPKFYALDMFPYPSGVGLHVGHPLGYIATDIVARFKKMRGYNVLHPMGFDAFGLPAEQYAVEHGVHPRVTTEKNIENIKRQLQRLGMGYDWSRCIATTDVAYYKWTQWIFLQLYHSYFDPVERKARPIAELIAKLEGEDYYVGINGELIYSGAEEDLEALGGIGDIDARKWYELEPDQQRRLLDEYRLAYLAEVDVNWCPALGTVLANEEVTNEGRSERGNHPVYKRPLRQWMLRITAYAERLIDELDLVDWPESIKLLQRNWIGKSRGAEVDFKIQTDPVQADSVQADSSAVSAVSRDPAAFDDLITVYTTRPDTLFGATYMVLAPEHPLVAPESDTITTPEHREAVRAYQAQAADKSEAERVGDDDPRAPRAAGKGKLQEKTGVFTGAYAVNPVNGAALPIYVADYVMMGYGTGAIMAVPGHDERDHAFARQYDLPIVEVVQAPQGHDIRQRAWTGEGALVNSANDSVSLNGLPVDDAKARITEWLELINYGRGKTQYKLRDWLFSRQRYWGEPFPILHELDDTGRRTGVIRAVDPGDLPVEHPHMEDFGPNVPQGDEGTDDATARGDAQGEPRPPLSRAGDDWKYVEIDGLRYEREFNTMPQWAGSCWYYLRYLDPDNDQRFVNPEVERYWMAGPNGQAAGVHAAVPGGVDLYVGGVEHAVLHLLYARFWHKVLFDLGHVSTPEPFGRLFNQGYIQAYYYEDPRGVRVEATEVTTEDGRPAHESQGDPKARFVHRGEPVSEKYGKMGKSLKNAIAPDAICEQYGCDTLRLYEMYMGPLDQSKPWATKDIVGVHRFLQRLWRNFIDEESSALRITDDAPSDELNRLLHKTIARVSDQMEAMAFNVAIAALIELNNALVPLDRLPRAVAEPMVLMLSPLAPHIAEELWAKLGHEPSVTQQPWPAHDPAMLVEDQIELPVQVNGKVRGKVTVPAAEARDEAAVQAAVEAAVAAGDERLGQALSGKGIRKVILIKGKIVNLVVG